MKANYLNNGSSKPTSGSHSSGTSPNKRSHSGIPSPTLKPSPDSSRDTSPVRKGNTTAVSTTTLTSRAKSAPHSPSQTSSAVSATPTPSAAAIQRALPGVTAERVKSTSRTDDQPKQSTTQSDGTSVTSPRLGPSRIKSPTPSAASSRRSSLSSSKQTESNEPSPSLSTQRPLDFPEKNLSPTQVQQRGPRGPSGLGSRLETVEEGDHSASPNNRTPLPPSLPHNQSEKPTANDTTSSNTPHQPSSKPAHSEAKAFMTEMNTSVASGVTNTAVQPTAPSRKPSTSSLTPAKTRPNAEGSKHMTVETETVPSIPQASLSNASDRAASARTNAGGSIRAKPSSETVRPKKDKKKITKKSAPFVSRPNSTKAELFEAQVASEIDGESTDSDETFVYESNPAEAQSRSRHHSRNPSTTSLASVADRHGVGLGSRVLTNGEGAADRPVKPKRSMKFASNSYASSSIDDESTDATHGTVRTHNQRPTARHELYPRHVGRVHRDTGQGSDSPLESDSPFSQAHRLRTGAGLGWRSPTKSARSPRSDTTTFMHTPTKKPFDNIPFDMNSGTSDDEREPLLRSSRDPRTRGPHHLRHVNFYDEPPRRSTCCGTLAGFVFILATVVVLTVLGGGFVFATSKPLYSVSVMEIQNVLASEQEIMLDLLVQATNPNIAQITISDVDVNVFAKSSHVADPRDPGHGDGELIKSRPRDRVRRELRHPTVAFSSTIRISEGVDDGTDPICPPWEPDCDFPGGADHDQQTMLLGRIFYFDSSLSFEPSPLRHLPSNSSGELRLAHPGNRTESGGSERWERVIQHPFELIIRGILKYQLPLSTREQTKSVGASVLVHPEEGVDEKGVMRVIQLGRLLPSEEYEHISGQEKAAKTTLRGEMRVQA